MQHIPITDNHIHLSPRGLGVEAMRQFERAGGTHAIVVCLPSWTMGVKIEKASDFRRVWEPTLRLVEQTNATTCVRAHAVLGVHPAELPPLAERMGLERAVDIIKGGLELAALCVEEGLAVGIKSGRPHWQVSDEMWEASCALMRHAMELARDVRCPVQLHTELSPRCLEDVGSMAREVGLPPHRVIKHYSHPHIDDFRRAGVFPSVLCIKGAVETAVQQGSDFFMETDYIDDPSRPGAVLGPKTVPRRTLALLEGNEELFWRVHVDNVERTYEIEVDG
ncbi:TatD family hydrolase [Methermicoccus shengliensis]|uniref:Metal-dependent hydrolase n=1 Tax=Methermicoccus shengliensis TaxID=660064 RepID=A0A832RVI7_9EURY|nr:TatD family hydrolase [Methermicoccus shengliensis]KUK04404.1 MAG: TatD-related deoxyribonuclease [Euryarchaeota archaeon 55_53]KUK30215.1 MAG: TatD-related deoxyribonuclease [Methanosarcinales archeaon 56_1174]MDI3488569.1 TatD-related deoxyribonuclease [Methanosarcinales archaeon]MDN5295775.1 TatD-related deoxyribonuclease [Methanosarcinales archaeon]HIH69053.1 metal-dependent hydrolase [Methermicoccus shengliensis]